MLMDLKKW